MCSSFIHEIHLNIWMPKKLASLIASSLKFVGISIIALFVVTIVLSAVHLPESDTNPLAVVIMVSVFMQCSGE